MVTSQPQRLRGVVLQPWPSDTVTLLADATIELQDGRITSVRPPLGGDPPWQPWLLLPGFVDLHCHWPQHQVRGRFGGQLLPWLRESIWPAEAELANSECAHQHAAAFVADLLRAGTCAGLFFGPPFAQASAVFAHYAPLGCIDGPALMEVNAPESLCTPVTESLDRLQRLGTSLGRPLALSPRFAPNVTAEGMRAIGAVAAATSWPVQSHLSENRDEVAWVADLFPQRQHYTDVYDAAGLLGPRTIYAHGIHLSDAELSRLAETGTWIAHCPTSNEALRSGRMALERLRAAGVPWVLATDVGAGPRLSLLDAMRAFLLVHRRHTTVTAVEALCRSTCHPGAFLSQFAPELQGLGLLHPGSPGHVVAVDLPGGPLEAESLLRALLRQTSPSGLETLPRAVWC
jgi:guanine deaminase